jgi:conjugative relaxase-like TrwC/TraI family protein
MMTVHKVGGAASGQYAAYLASHDGASRGDYYLGRGGELQHEAARWTGRGAAALGLEGEVRRAALLAAWDGKDPGSGAELVRRSAGGEHVAAIDCTFSAPKSVSVAWALADADHRAEIEAMQSRAVQVALAHIERHMPLVRRRIDGQITHESAGGLVVARFRHHTSRTCGEHAADGVAPDPQLHDHCAIANMALRRSDAWAANGRWAAIDSRELYRGAAEAGAVYRAELARGLQELGYAVHREGRYVELTGVPLEIRRAFSQRAAEVEAAIARFVADRGRQPTDEEVRTLAVRTRGEKPDGGRPAFEQWRSLAEVSGFDAKDSARLRQSPDVGRRTLADATRQIVHELTAIDGPASLTRQSAVVDRRVARIAIAEAAQGRVAGSEVGALIDAVLASPQVVHLDDEHLTTQPMLVLERRVIERAVGLGRSVGGAVGGTNLAAAISGARVQLSDDQAAAARRLAAGRQLALLTAPAGAGKGEVLRVVADAHRRAGRRVVALAAAGETAQRLGQEIGADGSRTIDSFVHRAREMDEAPDRDTVLVVDEAALLETVRWDALLDAAGPATIVAAGDDRQLSPIQAGGVWGVLSRRLGAAELRENFRAREQWARDAWAALREGAAPQALEAFTDHGLIELAKTRREAVARAVERWDADRRSDSSEIGESLLLTDASNVEVDSLNGLAQAQRSLAGELGADGVRVVADDAATGHHRDEVVYVGDRVVFERRFVPIGHDGRKTRRVENGSTATVVGVDPKRRVVHVDLGSRTVAVPAADLDALRLGYAQHIYSAQGRTVERSFVVLGGWQTDRERAYVGVSRSRGESVVFSDYDSLGVEKGRSEEAVAVLAQRCALSRRKDAATLHLDRRLQQLTTPPRARDDLIRTSERTEARQLDGSSLLQS